MKDQLFIDMYAMYVKGYSLEDVGKMFGKARQNVWQGFKIRKWGMRTKKTLPFIMVDGIKFSISKRGYYVATNGRLFLHRHIWQKQNGPIPKGYDIHHIDKNPLNNSLDNLVLLSHGDHRSLHQTKIYPPRQCRVCGKEFIITKAKQITKKTCSTICGKKLAILRWRDSIYKYGYGNAPKRTEEDRKY